MVKRVHLEAGRFILSRPGFAAEPSAPNAHKILDSDWGYAGMVIASGEAYDPAPVNGGEWWDEVTNSPDPWFIDIPDPGYGPTLIWGVESTFQGSNPRTVFWQNTYVKSFLHPPRIVGSRIRIDRIPYGNGARGRLGKPQFTNFDWTHLKFVYHVVGY